MSSLLTAGLSCASVVLQLPAPFSVFIQVMCSYSCREKGRSVSHRALSASTATTTLIKNAQTERFLNNATRTNSTDFSTCLLTHNRLTLCKRAVKWAAR